MTAPGAPSSAPLLECRGVTVRFGGLTALDDVDLTVHQGEIVGLIGPNGAGKSTLMECISGFQPVTAGVIRPQVWRRYPLADVAAAHAELEQGRSQGAIVLVP